MRRVWLGGAVVVATLACSVGQPTAKPAPTEAERRFGPSPPRDGSITYQRDVVLVEGGAEAVRAFAADGMTWTIDRGVANARDIVPGKIMFATGRAVGRVLAVRDDREGLAVTVGPVDLTEVYQELSLKFDQPLDLQKAIRYGAPEFPGVVTSDVAEMERPRLVPAAFRQTPDVLGRFLVTPFAGTSGIGFNFSTSKASVTIIGRATLRMNAPRLEFTLDVRGGKLRTALVRLHGASSIEASFEAGSEAGGGGNFSETIEIPVDFSVFDNVPPPFAVTVRQSFKVKTMFSAPGTVNAKARFNLAGALQFGYNGSWSPVGLNVTPQLQITDTLNGFSIGANGLVVGHKIRVIVGIGGAGFVVGPYVGVNTGFGAALGSRIGISQHTLLMSDKETCRGATFAMNLAAGVGYSLPDLVKRAVNVFLGILSTVTGMKIPPIAGSGGVEMPLFKLAHHEELQPSAQYCRGKLDLEQARW